MSIQKVTLILSPPPRSLADWAFDFFLKKIQTNKTMYSLSLRSSFFASPSSLSI